MRIHRDDRKRISAEARRLAKSSGVRCEIRRMWVTLPNGDVVSTFNTAAGTATDIDDSYSNRYSFDEFAAHSKDDAHLVGRVQLDVLVAKREGWGEYTEWEPVEFFSPEFEDGRLVEVKA